MTISSVPLFGLAVLILTAGCASSAARSQPDSQPQVTAADVQRNPDEPIESMIQRKVPGVILSRTSDGSIALYIRGATNVDGRPIPPLYVVDGLQMAPGMDGEIPVNPYDIDTIKVLKGPAAAIYGIDGAHGVIVITLKKGKN